MRKITLRQVKPAIGKFRVRGGRCCMDLPDQGDEQRKEQEGN